MAMALTSVSPETVSENGGYKLSIVGTGFNKVHQYMVYVGDKGTIFDHACYSGVPGQRNIIYPYSSTLIEVYSPRLPMIQAQTITVRDLTVPELVQLEGVMGVTYEDFSSMVFSMRKLLPLFYKTGPRDIDSVPPI